MSWLIFTAVVLLNLAGLPLFRRRQQALFEEIKATAPAAALAEELLQAAGADGIDTFRLLRPLTETDSEAELVRKSGDHWVHWRRLPTAQVLPLLDAFETLREAQTTSFCLNTDIVLPFRPKIPNSFYTSLPAFEDGVMIEIRLHKPGSKA